MLHAVEEARGVADAGMREDSRGNEDEGKGEQRAHEILLSETRRPANAGTIADAAGTGVSGGSVVGGIDRRSDDGDQPCAG